MSTPVDFSGSGRSSGQKPSFSRTCSLLSRYLKEKGSFGDLSLGMTCNLDDKGMDDPFLLSFVTFSRFLFLLDSSLWKFSRFLAQISLFETIFTTDLEGKKCKKIVALLRDLSQDFL